MADDPGYEHYKQWIIRQPCAATKAPPPSHPHHALYGTVYDPTQPPPRKAILNARKGGSQRSHDYFLMPLRSKLHRQFHDGTGFFAGWSPERRAQWEADQVEEMHRLYDAEFPNGDPALAAKTERAAARKASGIPRDAASKERERIVRVIRARAAERHHLPDQHQLLDELASDIAAGLNETGAF